MTAQEEHIIISKVRAGDTHAFAALVDAYKDLAIVTAYNILLSREDAEEVVQDAFVKAFRSMNGFRETSRFSSWLFRIVVNTALNKKKNGRHNTQDIAAIWDTTTDGELPGCSIQVNKDNRKHIQQALQHVPFNERLCLTLFYLNEYNVAEIHQLTGLSGSNIKILLYRGRKNLYAALRRLLQDELTNLI